MSDVLLRYDNIESDPEHLKEFSILARQWRLQSVMAVSEYQDGRAIREEHMAVGARGGRECYPEMEGCVYR